MFLIYDEFEKEGPEKFYLNERNYLISNRPYDIVETILLVSLSIEIIIKIIFIQKSDSKVSNQQHILILYF